MKAGRKRVGLKPIYNEHITSDEVIDNIHSYKYSKERKEAAIDFLTNVLKIEIDCNILATKLSRTSPILWIELDSDITVDNIIYQSIKMRNPSAFAFMYPPPEVFKTIKSIEANCKAAKQKNPLLRYQVKLGEENVELHIKNIGDFMYTKVQLDLFGLIVQPDLDRIYSIETSSGNIVINISVIYK